MSWVEFFQNATRLVNKKINSKAMIVNFAPDYFSNLTKVVQEYNKTSDGKMYVYLRDPLDMVHLYNARILKTKLTHNNLFFQLIKIILFQQILNFMFHHWETFKIETFKTVTEN